MGDRLDRAGLMLRTARNLRPAQMANRVRLRAQRFPPSRPLASSVVACLPTRRTPVAGWPAAFTPVDLRVAEGFPSAEDNAKGRFAFLADQRDLGLPVRWAAPGASRLWKYHLHYMEWAWSFAAHPDRPWARQAFAELWRSWEGAVPFGRGDQWSPYVASLRAWALCGVHASLVAGSEIEADVAASLDRHARFLRWHLERDVGGNHLVKNLKALVGLGVFLGDDRLGRLGARGLERQIPVQILADGGHYERSPSYHCQVLGDLLDVGGLLAAAGRPPVPGLADAVERMRAWLGVMLMPDGDVPLFNDCVLVGPTRLAVLAPGPTPSGPLTVLPASGYVVVRPDGRMHLVADVGDPCPPDLPAHAHADCLSFELAVDGARLVFDTGTSTYEPGDRRSYERSTSAHNTVTVDGADQTEVWGVFRAARLARATLERADDLDGVVTVVASHDGYRRLPGRPRHRRTWTVSAGRVAIVDDLLGNGHHRVESRLHLAGGEGEAPHWSGPPGLIVGDGPARHATGFGRLQAGRVVSASWHGRLPVRLSVEFHAYPAALQGSVVDDEAQAVTAP